MATVAQLPSDLIARVQELPNPRQIERFATVPKPPLFSHLDRRNDDMETIVGKSPQG